MPGRIENKVAIVTGSGRGNGKAIARRFASEGAYVMLNDINLKRLEQAQQENGEIAKSRGNPVMG